VPSEVTYNKMSWRLLHGIKFVALKFRRVLRVFLKAYIKGTVDGEVIYVRLLDIWYLFLLDVFRMGTVVRVF
jgi:hypothetical protein